MKTRMNLKQFRAYIVQVLSRSEDTEVLDYVGKELLGHDRVVFSPITKEFLIETTSDDNDAA